MNFTNHRVFLIIAVFLLTNISMESFGADDSKHIKNDLPAPYRLKHGIMYTSPKDNFTVNLPGQPEVSEENHDSGRRIIYTFNKHNTLITYRIVVVSLDITITQEGGNELFSSFIKHELTSLKKKYSEAVISHFKQKAVLFKHMQGITYQYLHSFANFTFKSKGIHFLHDGNLVQLTALYPSDKTPEIPFSDFIESFSFNDLPAPLEYGVMYTSPTDNFTVNLPTKPRIIKTGDGKIYDSLQVEPIARYNIGFTSSHDYISKDKYDLHLSLMAKKLLDIQKKQFKGTFITNFSKEQTTFKNIPALTFQHNIKIPNEPTLTFEGLYFVHNGVPVQITLMYQSGTRPQIPFSDFIESFSFNDNVTDVSSVFIKPKSADITESRKDIRSVFRELNESLAKERERKLNEVNGSAPPIVVARELYNLKCGLENIGYKRGKVDLRDVIYYLSSRLDCDLAVRLAGLEEGIHITGLFPRADVQKAIKHVQENCKGIPLADLKKAIKNMTSSEKKEPVNKVILFVLYHSESCPLTAKLFFGKISAPRTVYKFTECHAIEEYTKEDLEKLKGLKNYIAERTPTELPVTEVSILVVSVFAAYFGYSLFIRYLKKAEI